MPVYTIIKRSQRNDNYQQIGSLEMAFFFNQAIIAEYENYLRNKSSKTKILINNIT